MKQASVEQRFGTKVTNTNGINYNCKKIMRQAPVSKQDSRNKTNTVTYYSVELITTLIFRVNGPFSQGLSAKEKIQYLTTPRN